LNEKETQQNEELKSGEQAETPAVDKEEAMKTHESSDAAERPDEEEEARGQSPAATAAFGQAGPGSSRNGGKAWMFVAIGLAVLLVGALIRPPFANGDETVAKVNGVNIGKNALYDEMVKLGGKQTLTNMIQEELVKQEAEKAGVTVTDSDIQKEIDKIKKQFPTEQDFETALQQNGYTLDTLKAQMPMQIMIRKILEPKVAPEVTDDAVKQHFEQNKAQYDTQEQVRASHILVKTKEEADEIAKELKNGADFAKLAQEKSTDDSKHNGGDLNYFGRGQMVKEFEDVAFSLKVGEISEPVKSEFGYHIIKVTDHKQAHTATLDEKKAEIKDQLIGQKVAEMSESWLADVKAKADITNTLETEITEDSAGAAASTTEK
jgi:foldase protein PrsA